MRRLVLKVVFLGLLSSVLFAQSPADPSFEVASVRSNRTEAPATTLFPLGPGDAYAANGGRFRATNQPLITYLRFAYRLGQGDLLDLPKWVYNERFDIDTRANGEPAKDQMRLMMRSPERPFQARGAHRATDARHFRSRARQAWTDWTAAPRASIG